nr:hypothetical protein [Deltaproteobacteria bacterium]
MTCPPGQLVCARRCVDPQRDAAHCGACGSACAGGQMCSSGVCVGGGLQDAGRDVPVLDVGGSAACSATNLGSALGTSVASGTTAGRSSQHTPPATCTDMAAAVSPDAVYSWTAPYGGAFTFDTTGSAFDTMLTIRSGSYTGAVLGCNDDIVAGAEQASRLTVTLAAGQTVAIVVEGYGTNSGSFVLNASAGGVDAGGAGGVDAGGADPCGGVTIDGRCASTTLLEYCSIATGEAVRQDSSGSRAARASDAP